MACPERGRRGSSGAGKGRRGLGRERALSLAAFPYFKGSRRGNTATRVPRLYFPRAYSISPRHPVSADDASPNETEKRGNFDSRDIRRNKENTLDDVGQCLSLIPEFAIGRITKLEWTPNKARREMGPGEPSERRLLHPSSAVPSNKKKHDRQGSSKLYFYDFIYTRGGTGRRSRVEMRRPRRRSRGNEPGRLESNAIDCDRGSGATLRDPARGFFRLGSPRHWNSRRSRSEVIASAYFARSRGNKKWSKAEKFCPECFHRNRLSYKKPTPF